METKRLTVEVKDEEEGVVTARFATLGVRDKDGDLIEPGAFGNQRVKVSAYGHTSWGGALPVGVGETRESGDEAIADLEFFMSTRHGRDHFETIKGLGDLGEWSFGFDILEEAAPTEEQEDMGVRRVLKQLEVHEVSPVLRGSGIDTRTLGVKCDECAAKVGGEVEEKPPAPEPGTEDEKDAAEELPKDATTALADGESVAELDEPGREKGEDEDLREEFAREVARYEAMKVAAER